MRRLILAAALAASLACNRNKKVNVEVVEEQSTGLASVVHVADPKASIQLVKGFHEIEQNAWRWTMGKFAVTLAPPQGGAQKGANLVLKFSIPEPVADKLKSITLSANVNGTPVAAETFDKSGEHVYSKPVPAAALGGDAVGVEFALDKFFPPGQIDQRELGVVVSTIGFESQ